ncbi:MAG: low-specificity L-threonine aldolase [Firmicutes bacterium]|nr:low-specificity L-threonine aldolase [Bacillota bacterium]
MEKIDFRSDTLTKPTDEMRRAMSEASVGDDVYKEDPTINKLENLASKIVGKEEALFVPSGTMGNQLALLTHTNRGEEIILEEWSHIYRFEVGGLSFLSGLQAKPIKGENGIMELKDIKREIIKDNDIHHAQTSLICMENTHNMAGGVVTPLKRMEEIYNLAKDNEIKVHLDGARMFNASIYLDTDIKEITNKTDSVMFCLSKGLSAPVGSILAGDKDFIKKARRYRKMLGGGMRQAGILAAAGIISLNNMVDRLKLDNENIKLLADKLSNIKSIDVKTPQTNILMIDVSKSKFSSEEVIDKLKDKGILTSKITNNIIRFVTHRHISKEDILYSTDIFNKIIK